MAFCLEFSLQKVSSKVQRLIILANLTACYWRRQSQIIAAECIAPGR